MTKLGKLWTGAVAYVSLLVGAGLSVAGNLADTYRTRGADIDNLDKVMAAGWPILVLLAIEMFVSPRWSPARMFQVWRWVGCLAVGGMAMVVSWTHLHDLMADRGQLFIVSVLGPLAIDGMAIMATGLILSTRVRGHIRTSADTDMPNQDVRQFMAMSDADATAFADKMKAAMAADSYASGSFVRTHETDNPWTDSYVSADAPPPVHADEDVRGRWADLTTPVTPADMADLMSWANGQDRAHADIAEELATEVQAHLAAVTDELPRRTRTAGGPVPQEFLDMVKAWDGQEPKRADVVKQTANWWHVSTRTARRWLNIALGEPVSGPPVE